MTTKRSLAVALALALVAGAFGAPAADAKKKKKKAPKKVTREAEGSYDAPPLVLIGSCTSSGAIGCVALPSGAGEHYVTASVSDAHGQPVYVSVQANLEGGDNADDTVYGGFCGETSEPLLIDESVELHFWVGFTPDTGAAGCVPGGATTGTVSVTFSNIP